MPASSSRAPLHILLVTDYFPPEIAAPAHLLFDLATELTARGHRVTVVTGFPRYNVTGAPSRYRRRLLAFDTMGEIGVWRVWRPSIDRSRLLARGIDHLLSPLVVTVAALRVPRPDVVIVLSPPLPLALTGYAVKALRGARFVLNVQDLFPQNAIDLGVLSNRVLIGLFRVLERWAYRVSDAVTVHSPGNAQHVKRQAAGTQVVVIPNWVDTSKLVPLPRHNEFSAIHGLDDKFVVSFAGTMGFSQDMDVILGASELLRNEPGILFLLVGDGVQKAHVVREVERRGLPNVKLLPTQDRDTYPWVLASSDVSLATLKADVKTPVVPSKILSVMAAGRPIIGCMPLDGDAPALIRESEAGMALPPGDAEALANAITKLYADRLLCAEMGQNGRTYIERYLSLKAAADRYLQLFYRIAGRPVEMPEPELSTPAQNGQLSRLAQNEVDGTTCVSIRDATDSDLEDIVLVHQAAFPGFLMTQLGKGFLKRYYKLVLSSSAGSVIVAAERGQILGFVAGYTRPAEFYAHLRRCKLRLAIDALPALLHRPWLLTGVISSFRRTGTHVSTPHRGLSELASIAVHPERAGKGIGTQLVRAFLDLARRQGAQGVYLTTDAQENDRVNRFYSNLGFSRAATLVTRKGRIMNEYRFIFEGSAASESNLPSLFSTGHRA